MNPATTGRWQRGDPQADESRAASPLQPGTCEGGSVNCLVTGLTAAFGRPAANDVDGGLTSDPVAGDRAAGGRQSITLTVPVLSSRT